MKQTYNPLVKAHRFSKPIQKREAHSYDLDAIFVWIVKFKRAHDGNSPALCDIMEQFGVSSKSVAKDLLDRLERAGRIRRNGGNRAARCIEVVGGRWVFVE